MSNADQFVLTPVGVERKLIQIVSAMTHAQGALVDARDMEISMLIVYKRAQDRAAARTPKVQRGEMTVDERAQRIDEATRHEWAEFVTAEKTRKNCEDALRVLRDQMSAVQSLGASVRAAYGVAGAGAA